MKNYRIDYSIETGNDREYCTHELEAKDFDIAVTKFRLEFGMLPEIMGVKRLTDNASTGRGFKLYQKKFVLINEYDTQKQAIDTMKYIIKRDDLKGYKHFKITE